MKTTDSEMDTKYSCVLVTVSAMSFLLIVGNIKIFGILYAELLEYYGSGAGYTAWIGSVCIFLTMALGPIANHLCIVYTFRTVMVTGGVLSSCGYLLTSLMPRMEWMYLTFGIVVGTGYGLLFSTTTTIISFYVEKRRALATGLMVAGGGVGVFILPYLYRVLINMYGIHGCFMVLGAVNLHICIAAMIARQPKALQKKRIQHTQIKELGIIDGKKETTATEEYNQSSCNINQGLNSDKKLPWTSTSGLLDITVFRNPSVAVFSLAVTLHHMAYIFILIIISPHIVNLGYSDEKADFVMSINGAAEVLSKILFGWLADRAHKQRVHLLVVTIVLSGVSAIVISFLHWYPVLAIYGVTVGTFTCAFLCLVPIIVIDMVGMDRFPSTIGKMFFIFSIPYMFGPPIAGWLKDLTGSWILSFRVAGCLSIIAGILITLDYFTTKYGCCCKKNPG